jgi:hypothetical protein
MYYYLFKHMSSRSLSVYTTENRESIWRAETSNLIYRSQMSKYLHTNYASLSQTRIIVHNSNASILIDFIKHQR